VTADSEITTPVDPPAELFRVSLPASLRSWLVGQAEQRGLPSATDFVLLLLRLEKQQQDLAGVAERYQQVSHGPPNPPQPG
jgi:hypothetical protein